MNGQSAGNRPCLDILAIASVGLNLLDRVSGLRLEEPGDSAPKESTSNMPTREAISPAEGGRNWSG